MFKGAVARGILFSLISLGTSARADFSYRFDQYFSEQYTQPATSRANPDNKILKTPDHVLAYDLRPEFKFKTTDTIWVLRPRWLLENRVWTSTEIEPSQTAKGRADLTDAYLDWRWTDSLKLTTGLEVYQWGPAELFNASNPLYHLNTNGRSAYFKEKGQALIRLTWDTTRRWTNMIVVNPVSNNEPAWQADREFIASGFFKTEYRNRSGDSYIGALGGTQPDGRAFFGETACLSSKSGWSAYVDGRHPIGTRAYAPEVNGLGQPQMIKDDDEQTMNSLVISGIRYEGRADIRLEYLYNSEGYSTENLDLALDSTRTLSPQLPRNLNFFARPGLELLGKHYVYFSVRWPDIGWKREGMFAIRTLTAVQDGSTIWQTAFDQPVGDSLVLDLEANLFTGDDDRELTLVERALLIAGFKWTL